MVSPFRNAAGVDLDDVFEAGNGPTAPFLRRADGTPLQYAPLSAGSKAPNVGYAPIGGADVSNLWAAKGSVPTNLPFNGSFYTTSSRAAENSQGIVSASTSFRVFTPGTFDVVRTSGSPQSGSVLLGGGPVGEYSYRITTVSEVVNYETPGFDGSVTNGASTLAPVGAGNRAVTVVVNGPAASLAQFNFTQAVFRFELFRNGVLVSDNTFTLRAQASGWQ